MNSYVTLEIKGKDVKRFIRNLHKQNIKFYNINYNKNSVHIKVNEQDYKKIKEIKTIYEINIIKFHGALKINEFLKFYKDFFIILFLGITLLYFLSNIIFEIDIVYEKKEIREFIYEELEKYDIKKYKFIKSFDYNEKVVSSILKEHKSKIEWLEIERVGCKYIIKVEERKVKNNNKIEVPQNVVAKKKGLILEIKAKTGEVIKKINDYVNEGDIIVSGTIMNKEEIKGYVKADAKIFAETWYNVTVSLPTFYKEVTKTGNKKNNINIKFLNNKYSLFSSYKDSEDNIKFSIKNKLLPISINYVEEEEVNVIDEIYNYDNAYLKASEMAKEKLLSTLGKEDEIIYEKSLKIYEEDSKIIVVIFFKVKEDITSYQDIIIPEPENVSPNKENIQ